MWPDRSNQRFTGENPVAENPALRRTKSLIPPIARIESFQHVRLLGVFARGLDDDFHRPSVGQHADTARILPRQAEAVEQLVGLLQIDLAQASRYSFLYSGLCGSTVFCPSSASP